MKIIVIGASGKIGKAVTKILQENGHQVVEVGFSHGEFTVDITSEDSIKQLMNKVQPFDGLICAAGVAYTGPLEKMGQREFYKGIDSKLMGQVNLVIHAKNYIQPGGFITLTSGNLSEEPKAGAAGLGLVNGAINGFAVNAALELPHDIRLNVVSPSVLKESVAIYGQSPGRQAIPANEVAEVYLSTINDGFTGQIVKAYGLWL